MCQNESRWYIRSIVHGAMELFHYCLKWKLDITPFKDSQPLRILILVYSTDSSNPGDTIRRLSAFEHIICFSALWSVQIYIPMCIGANCENKNGYTLCIIEWGTVSHSNICTHSVNAKCTAIANFFSRHSVNKMNIIFVVWPALL